MKLSRLLLTALFSLLSAALISGCSQNPLSLSTKNQSAGAFSGTYLFVGECQNKLAQPEQVKGLFATQAIATLAGSALLTGIDWLGEALQKAAEADIEKTTVSTNIKSIQQLSTPTNICMQVVRGSFTYAQNKQSVSHSFTNALAIDTQKRLAAPVQVVKGTEELFIEILPVIHQQVISFVPLEIRYSGYTPTDKHNKRPRDLAVFVGFSSVNNDVTKGSYTGRLINFGTMVPAASKPAIRKFVSKDGKLSLVKQTQWLALNNTDSPLTLAVTVIETREASRFTQFLAKVFNSSKADIKSQAAAALAELEIFKTSKELEKEKLAREQEQLKNIANYFDSEAAVISRTQTLSTTCRSAQADRTAIYNAQKELYLAKQKANISAALAGKQRPYPSSSIRPPSGVCGEN